MSKFNPLDYPVSLAQPLRIAPSTWLTHTPFAMFIVDLLRPSIFVELGTQYGVSYCAFCQAVKALELRTRCYAIDTWRGDAQAGQFNDDVLLDLKEHHDPLYADFSLLIQNTFDKALEQFADKTIDLLHIDGYHTYDAVKNDFYNWLPKMSERGVILFHDINVRDRDFGVWKLWDELKLIYPYFDFDHGYGLGILAVGEKYPSSLELLLNASYEIPNIRKLFLQLGAGVEKEYILTQVQALTDRVDALTNQVKVVTIHAEGLRALADGLTAQVDGLTAQLLAQKESAMQASEALQAMQAMQASKAWKLVTVLRRIRYWLLPPNSLRERLAQFLFKGLK